MENKLVLEMGTKGKRSFFSSSFGHPIKVVKLPAVLIYICRNSVYRHDIMETILNQS